MTVEIQLTKGKVALVNEKDAHKVQDFQWQARKSGNGPWYASRSVKDPSSGKRITVYLHRVVAECPEGLFVDHINHDGLDNRSENLRVCTKRENRRYSYTDSNESKTSQFKGVTWRKSHKAWYARITLHGKNIGLGHFRDEREAANAYDTAARKHFGQFALTNF